MANAKDADVPQFRRILTVGRTGAGKSTQIWTLPGKKFAYIFDPNTLASIQGCDVDYELFLPDATEVDATLKGFNKNSKSDTLGPASRREPQVYMKWVADLNTRVENGFFKEYDWLIFDSATFIAKAVMDRQLFINGRYGDIEDLGDFRVVGSKLADVFSSIAGLPINIYATGHITSFQDDKTKKIEVQLNLPGRARTIWPLIFTDVWLLFAEDGKWKVRTKPEPRGLQDIRCSITGLDTVEDVTLSRIDSSVEGREGIGKIISRSTTNGLRTSRTERR
jgi:hypothetical protein